MHTDLAKYLLPNGILDFFEIVDDKTIDKEIHFYLEEKNIVPTEYQSQKTHSKGFSSGVTIEDFPLRGNTVLLHIKRRRWTIVESGEIIKRNWDLVA